MHIQVKHRDRTVSLPARMALGMMAILWAGTAGLSALENGETTAQMTYQAAGLRAGQPVFGLAVRHTKSGARVSQIFEGGPAAKAGLQPGDTLLSGDDVALGAKSQRELLAFLASRSAAVFHVRDAQGAERTVRVPKAAPETFAGAKAMITVRTVDLALADVEIGKPPPDFAAQANGKKARLSELSGQPVVVIFWATWCLPCMAERPALKTLYAKFHARGVEFVGVSLDDDRTKMEHDLKEHDIPWPQNFDGKGTDNVVAQEWGVTSIPVLVLIGRDGRVLEKKVPIERLGSALEKALR